MKEGPRIPISRIFLSGPVHKYGEAPRATIHVQPQDATTSHSLQRYGEKEQRGGCACILARMPPYLWIGPLSLLAALALAGCDQRALFEKSIPKEQAEFSRNYLALFQARNFESIEAKIAPSLRNAQLRSKLEEIANFFPAEKPTDIEIVEAQTLSRGNTNQFNLTFQYGYHGKWLLANVVLEKKAGETIVMGINAQQLPDSLEHINRVTFAGKSIRHFTIFALAIIFPLLIIFTTILCIKTPIPKRKWLWVIFILFGFVRITLRWSDGKLYIDPIHAQFLGAGFLKSIPCGPLLLSVAIPIGAIVFLLRRKKWLAQANQANGSFQRTS